MGTVCLTTEAIPPEHFAVVVAVALVMLGMFIGIALCNHRDAKRIKT